MFTFLCLAVCYAPDLLNNLFDSTMRVDRSMHFHFQVQALLISRKSILEQKALVPGGDQRISCSVISMTMLGNETKIMFRKPNLVFRITTPGVGRQLLIWDGPLNCRLVLLSLPYMGDCVITFINISPLLGPCIGHLKVIGKRTSLGRFRILSSPILFKEVTAMKNPHSLDDFLVAKIFH